MLMDAAGYRESLRAYHPRVFVNGQHVESVADEPLLVFLGDTPLKGPDAVRAALQARAAQPGGLGQMTYEWFETLQFDVNTTVASGRVVVRRAGKTQRGLFTRVLRRTPEGWRIVHDQLAWGPEA